MSRWLLSLLLAALGLLALYFVLTGGTRRRASRPPAEIELAGAGSAAVRGSAVAAADHEALTSPAAGSVARSAALAQQPTSTIVVVDERDVEHDAEDGCLLFELEAGGERSRDAPSPTEAFGR